DPLVHPPNIGAAMSFLATPSRGLKRRGDASAAADAPPNKGQISELLAAGEDVSTVAKLLVVLANLSLTSAADIRETTGMPWNASLADVKGSVAKHMLEQGRVDHEATNAAKNDPAALEALGPPYAHVFAGLMQGVAGCTLGDSMKVPLASFWEEPVVEEGRAPTDLLGKVLPCKCKPAKSKEGRPGLVQVAIAMGAARAALQSCLAKAMTTNGRVLKRGPAPRGPLERAAQELLEELGVGKSKKDKGKGTIK
ncbi:unnamed protein product, partial [Prorocentrum cordatum]